MAILGRRLGLPLLMAERTGGHREPFPRLGPLRVGVRVRAACPPTSPSAGRAFSSAGAPAGPSDRPRIHVGREIIARD